MAESNEVWVDWDLSFLEGKWQPVTLILIVIGVMATRLRNVQAFITNGGVKYPSLDMWYQQRSVEYTVENWPFPISFDPWVGYPSGATPDKFGTLFEQVVATLSLILGGGSPDSNLVGLILLAIPVVSVAITIVLVYMVVSKLYGKNTAIVSSVILALTPGVYFTASLPGRAQSYIATPVLLLLTVYFFIQANSSSSFDIKSYDIKWLWAGMTGLALGALVLFAPSNTVLVYIFAASVFVEVIQRYIRGSDVDSLLETSIVAFSVASLVSFSVFPVSSFSINSFGWNHILNSVIPFVLFTVVYFVEKFVNVENDWVMPVSMASFPIVFYGAVSLLSLDTFSGLLKTPKYILGIESGQGVINSLASTISSYNIMFQQFGSIPLLAIIGLIIIWGSLYLGDDNRHITWISTTALLIGLTSLSYTQWLYTLAPIMVVLSAYSIYWLAVQLEMDKDFPHLEGYQYAVIGIVLVLFIPVVFYPVSGSVFVSGADHTPVGDDEWDETLDWVEKNTPEEGNLEGINNTLDYNGNYNPSSFVYKNGTYGVLSWSPYGYWITTESNRVSIASPMPTENKFAAQFLTSQSEDKADSLLMDKGANARYIIVDQDMVSNQGYYPSIVEASQKNLFSFGLPLYDADSGQITSLVNQDKFYRSMASRLYYFNGSSVDRTPLVVDWDMDTTSGSSQQVPVRKSDGRTFKQFNSISEAEDFVEENQSAQIGGVGQYSTTDLSALSHYRVVHMSETDEDNSMSNIKVFERVPGAKVNGKAPPNSTVTATVSLKSESGKTFIYSQEVESDADGSFEMRVPYSTEGYEEWGPKKGYTDVSVKASGPYTFSVSTQNQLGQDVRHTVEVDIPESSVVGKDPFTEQIRIGVVPTEE